MLAFVPDRNVHQLSFTNSVFFRPVTFDMGVMEVITINGVPILVAFFVDLEPWTEFRLMKSGKCLFFVGLPTTKGEMWTNIVVQTSSNSYSGK